MSHRPHRRWKGCCIMCGFHTLRGLGRSYKDSQADKRRLGLKRRYGRRDAAADWYE